MKTRKFLSLLVAPLFAFGLAACDVDQTQEGDLPDVDVEGGQVPEYDVDAADVDVGTDTQTVVVPDVDVQNEGEPEAQDGDASE
ncbi:MAG TPA: hypothetical protein VF039_09320 [Longimicrobiales bacterium]